MTVDYKKHAIEGLAWRLAHENLGVYPSSVQGGPGAYEERSPWMNGWNDAQSAELKLAIRIEAYFKAIDEPVRATVLDLLLEERLSVHCPTEENIALTVDCSDLFFWACSDCEHIELSEMADLMACYELTPRHGELLWCCRKRQMRPQLAYYKFFSESEAALFDAAGPERDDPDGKKRIKNSGSS